MSQFWHVEIIFSFRTANKRHLKVAELLYVGLEFNACFYLIRKYFKFIFVKNRKKNTSYHVPIIHSASNVLIMLGIFTLYIFCIILSIV